MGGNRHQRRDPGEDQATLKAPPDPDVNPAQSGGTSSRCLHSQGLEPSRRLCFSSPPLSPQPSQSQPAFEIGPNERREPIKQILVQRGLRGQKHPASEQSVQV